MVYVSFSPNVLIHKDLSAATDCAIKHQTNQHNNSFL